MLTLPPEGCDASGRTPQLNLQSICQGISPPPPDPTVTERNTLATWGLSPSPPFLDQVEAPPGNVEGWSRGALPGRTPPPLRHAARPLRDPRGNPHPALRPRRRKKSCLGGSNPPLSTPEQNASLGLPGWGRNFIHFRLPFSMFNSCCLRLFSL